MRDERGAFDEDVALVLVVGALLLAWMVIAYLNGHDAQRRKLEQIKVCREYVDPAACMTGRPQPGGQ